MPGLVNLAIGFLLATSLLAVIGAFDLLNTARTATTDRDWLGFYDEAYIFAAAIYFLLCFAARATRSGSSGDCGAEHKPL